MKKMLAVRVVVPIATVAAHLGLTPTAYALCTPQQWQDYPAKCQQTSEAENRYNAQAAQLVCDLVSAEPTPRGVWAALSFLMSEDRSSVAMPRSQILNAMGSAIWWYCPQYMDVYREYRSISP